MKKKNANLETKIYPQVMKPEDIEKEMGRIKQNTELCHDERFAIQKQIEELSKRHRDLGNYIQRSEDDLDTLSLKLRKAKEGQ